MSVRTLQDILTLEQTKLPNTGLNNTYALIARGAAINPQAPALSFFVRVEDHANPVRWTYAQWLADITRAANMFRRLGIRPGGALAPAGRGLGVGGCGGVACHAQRLGPRDDGALPCQPSAGASARTEGAANRGGH